MNLHVTSDSYGLFPKQIAMRIKRDGSSEKNKMVNLGERSAIQDEIITYISDSPESINNFIATIEKIDKIIFHPYNFLCYNFLQVILKKYPNVQVYWAFWSYDLYNLPHLTLEHYEPFAKNYVKEQRSLLKRVKDLKIVGSLVLKFCYATGIKKNHTKKLIDSFKDINFFCSFLPSDFLFFEKVSSNKRTKYLPFAYLSLDDIVPDPDNFEFTPGNKIMIGHSSSPSGNHYEIIQRLGEINPDFSVFLPLAYGDENYGNLIEKEAFKKFKAPDVQRQKLDSVTYSRKLTEVGWAIINVKVQQGLGNIIALIFMGVKVFLDEDSSTYKDFSDWGIVVFTVQHDLNLFKLSNKLSKREIENNRAIISNKCNSELVKQYWNNILF
jgi:hypothetical protein